MRHPTTNPPHPTLHYTRTLVDHRMTFNPMDLALPIKLFTSPGSGNPFTDGSCSVFDSAIWYRARMDTSPTGSLPGEVAPLASPVTRFKYHEVEGAPTVYLNVRSSNAVRCTRMRADGLKLAVAALNCLQNSIMFTGGEGGDGVG